MNHKKTINDIKKAKIENRKFTMLTAYTYPMAKIIDSCGVDIILVGDSAGNVILGYKNTVPVTMDEMLILTKAVNRGVTNALLVADMPFMSYQLGVKEALYNASKLIKEANAEAVKIEGVEYLDAIKEIIKAGIPVMGHLGFMPQSINKIGCCKVQGKDHLEVKRIIEDAMKLQEAGAFAIVLELIPSDLAKQITESLNIPTIGIGAGPHCNGQVLVTHDLIGMTQDFVPKFVKQFANISLNIKNAINEFREDVITGKYPEENISK